MCVCACVHVSPVNGCVWAMTHVCTCACALRECTLMLSNEYVLFVRMDV